MAKLNESGGHHSASGICRRFALTRKAILPVEKGFLAPRSPDSRTFRPPPRSIELAEDVPFEIRVCLFLIESTSQLHPRFHPPKPLKMRPRKGFPAGVGFLGMLAIPRLRPRIRFLKKSPPLSAAFLARRHLASSTSPSLCTTWRSRPEAAPSRYPEHRGKAPIICEGQYERSFFRIRWPVF